MGRLTAVDQWQVVAAERLALADLLEPLTPQQWATPSLCEAWTVRDLAAHLLVPFRISKTRFALDMVRAAGRFERANVAATSREARRPTEDLVADLRMFARKRFVAPGLPPVSAQAEALVHGQDIRIPLGVDDTGDPQNWAQVMTFLLTTAARRGFVAHDLPPLTWTASDVAFSSGSGERVEGPVAALALTAMGRPALVHRLDGPGMSSLRPWLATKQH